MATHGDDPARIPIALRVGGFWLTRVWFFDTQRMDDQEPGRSKGHDLHTEHTEAICARTFIIEVEGLTGRRHCVENVPVEALKGLPANIEQICAEHAAANGFFPLIV